MAFTQLYQKNSGVFLKKSSTREKRKERKKKSSKDIKQDGRLPPACFSHEHKIFDQHLPTVKSETTVQNLVHEGFLQTSIPSLISMFYAKEGVSRFSVDNFWSHSTENSRWGALLTFKTIL